MKFLIVTINNLLRFFLLKCVLTTEYTESGWSLKPVSNKKITRKECFLLVSIKSVQDPSPLKHVLF